MNLIVHRCIAHQCIVHRRIVHRWRIAARALLAICVLGLGACERQEPPTSPTVPQSQDQAPAERDPALEEATRQAWSQAAEILAQSISEAETLRSAIQSLLASPSDETLSGTRLAWHRAHDSFARFGPFGALADTSPGLFGQLDTLTLAIDAWPMQPGFVDYFDVYLQSGIVNDIAMPLTADALRQQHGLTASSDVALGFHAMEYLLWGEQGQRPAADYQEIKELTSEQQRAGMSVVELPSNRRRVYLQLLVELLLDDLVNLEQQISNQNAALRQNYLMLQPQSRLQALQHASAYHLRELQLQFREQNPAEANAETTENGETENDGAVSGEDGELFTLHNAFAGRNAQQVGQALTTIESALLSEEQGLGKWIFAAADTTEAANSVSEQVASLREQLLTWHDQSWPPPDPKRQEMLATLNRLIALFYPAQGNEEDEIEDGAVDEPEATN